MEKRLKRIEIFVIITFALVLFSILLQLATLGSLPDEPETPEVAKEMPPAMEKDSINKITYQVKTDWNDSDWNKFHALFGDFAQAQIRESDVEHEFSKLKSATGNIMSFAFSHYEYTGFAQNADWFDYYFKCMFDNGKGTIKLSTRTLDGQTEITGININLDGF